MKREHDVAALEVLLRVKVQRATHSPPPTVLAVDIPDVVNVRSDALYGDLLQMDNWIIAHLVLEVGENHLSLAGCRFHGPCLLHFTISTVAIMLLRQDDTSQDEEGTAPANCSWKQQNRSSSSCKMRTRTKYPLILSVHAAV